MQSDIISKILEAEENASKLVASAQQKATKLVFDAETESGDNLKQAKKERRLLNHQKLKEIKEQNEAEILSYRETVKDAFVIDTNSIEKIAKTLANKI